MVGVAYDCLANPLGAVRSTFAKAIASGSDPASFDGKDWGAVDLFRGFLFDDGGLAQVPILNSATIRWIQPNTLVRFRGMIQDMLGNELYVGAYKDGTVWRTNKFTDVPQFPMESSPPMRLWERRMLYCIPVPGQNSWTEPEAVMYRSMGSATQQREKRQRLDAEATDDMDYDVSADGLPGSPRTKKLREDGHPSLSTQSQAGTSSSMTMVPEVNSDLLPCLVKIYDCPESDLKLNEVFEFIGVFTFDSEFKVDKDECDDSTIGLSEDLLVHLPPNKVPRLHCFTHRKLAVHDFLPSSPTLEPKPHLVKEIREGLLRHLTAVLGNDGVAAHFMLLHLLSTVYSRVDTVAVGKLSLNLTCFSKESMPVFGNQLRLAIKNLLPFTECIPITVDYFNTASFVPRKDYETNRLITGALQLAEGSHLIFDETRLEAGTLNSVGVENARLLKTLLELQKVEYDFKFYKLDMATDVQMLILSEGKSNILPADVVLPFHPCSVGSSEIAAEAAVEAWRWYLATLRSLPHTIESEMQKVLENDLVAARQEDRKMGTQDFSRLLTMGRLMCMSFGETCLSLQHWQMVKELERLRRERLK